jgi:hypothetical protein
VPSGISTISLREARGISLILKRFGIEKKSPSGPFV